MGSVAALLVLIEAPRAWWIVIPAAGRGLEWVDVAAMAAVLGVAAAIALSGIAVARASIGGRRPCLKPSESIPDARHEPTDIGAGFIWGAVAVCLGTLLACALLVLWLYPAVQARSHACSCRFLSIPSRACSPIRQQDLQRFYAEEMQILNGSGWVDKERGVVHIPITQAMREVAQEGIAGWPAASPRIRHEGILAVVARRSRPSLAPLAGHCASAPDPNLYAFHERPGARLPAQPMFLDSDGRAVHLSELSRACR